MNKKFLKTITTLALTSAPILSSIACSSNVNADEKKYRFQNSWFSSRQDAENKLRKIAKKIKKDKISIADFLFSFEKVRDINMEERVEYFYSKILEFTKEKFQTSSEESNQGTHDIHRKIKASFSKLQKSYILKKIIESEKKVSYLKQQQKSIDFNPKELQEHNSILEGHLTFYNKNKDKLFIVKSKDVLENENAFLLSMKPLKLFNEIWKYVLKINYEYGLRLNDLKSFKEIHSILVYFSSKDFYFDSLDSLSLWVKEKEDLFNIKYDLEYQDLSNILNGYNPYKKFLTIEEAIEKEIVLYEN